MSEISNFSNPTNMILKMELNLGVKYSFGHNNNVKVFKQACILVLDFCTLPDLNKS